MKFFTRRGRSRSVDRNAKSKRDQQQQYQPQQPGSRSNDKRSNNSNAREDDSIGSDLPTLDQFEIAVPTKSFATSVSDADHRHQYEPEGRDDDDGDNRSFTDISSITSVSYRAGYYYLRNVKNRAYERNRHTECLPGCSCSTCMPCSCSWLSCCCCYEAKSELAAANRQRMMMNSQLRDKARKAHSPGRRSGYPSQGHPSQGHQALGPLGYPQYQSGRDRRRTSSHSQRYAMSSGIDQPSQPPEDEYMYPSLQRNHSLFDELSEDGEKRRFGGQKGRNQQLSQKKNKQKNWLRGRTGATGAYVAPQEYGTREKSSRNRSRGRGRQAERYDHHKLH